MRSSSCGFGVSGRTQPRAALAAGLAVSICLLLFEAGSCFAAPFIPDDPSTVVAVLPERKGPVWRDISELRGKLEEAPGSHDLVARLVRNYLDLFRVDADPRLLGFAAATLEPWNDTLTPPRDLALQRAALAGLQHRFDDAASELDRLIAQDPRDGQARLSRAALYLLRGEYAASERACAQLVLSYDPAVAGVCVSAVQMLTGRAEQSYAFLTAQLEGASRSTDPSLEIWTRTLAAENAAALGNDVAAEAHFRAAIGRSILIYGQASTYLLAAYSDALLRADRNTDALGVLDNASENDALLLRRARAKRSLGLRFDEELEALRYRLQLALTERDATHAREAAYFALYLDDDPVLAERLAISNWSVQREPMDAELVLASTLALCKPNSAAPVLIWLESNAVENVVLEALQRGLEDCA